MTEIGLDLSAFPTEAHFVAWLGLARRAAVSESKLPKHGLPHAAVHVGLGEHLSRGR